MENTRPTQTRFAWIAQILLVQLALVLLVYPLIHELGHSIVVLLVGGQVTGISLGLFEAHMSFTGLSNVSQTGIFFVSVAGVLLPYLCYLVFLLLVRRKASPFVQKIKWCSLFVVLGSLSVWIVMPLTSYIMAVPAGDDVTQALVTHACPRVLLSVVAALLFALCVALFVQKGGSLTSGLNAKKEQSREG